MQEEILHEARADAVLVHHGPQSRALQTQQQSTRDLGKHGCMLWWELSHGARSKQAWREAVTSAADMDAYQPSCLQQHGDGLEMLVLGHVQVPQTNVHFRPAWVQATAQQQDATGRNVFLQGHRRSCRITHHLLRCCLLEESFAESMLVRVPCLKLPALSRQDVSKGAENIWVGRQL